MTKGRRRLLGVVLVSIAVNAALGIYALLVPDFGDLQARVLATSACVTGAAVLSFACLPAWEQGRLKLVPPAGVVTSILGFALLVAGVWADVEEEPFWKTAGTLLVAAGACVLASVLSLARLAPRYRAAFLAAGILAGVLAAMIVAAIWGEPDSEAFVRVLGVVAVLLGALTLAVPILHRASRGELGVEEASVRYCPACGRELSAPAGVDGVCDGCGARFRVRYLR